MMTRCNFSDTLKDSNGNKRSTTVLELVRRDDGDFDLFSNAELLRSRIQERWLPEEICVRYGFCGPEYDKILHEAKRVGRARIAL